MSHFGHFGANKDAKAVLWGSGGLPWAALSPPEAETIGVEIIVSELGVPKSPDDVVQIADDAYATINERFKARQPSKQPMRSSTKGKLGGVPVPEPNSMRDIVSQALQAKV